MTRSLCKPSRLSHVIRLKKEKPPPRAGTAPTIPSRNQKAKATPAAVRANLDDPPVHIRPTIPAISGCTADEPFRFGPPRHTQGAHSDSFNRNGFFCRSINSQAITR
jgi:hypothetical protein